MSGGSKMVFVYPKTSAKRSKTPYPPLGIGSLATVLMAEEIETSIIDGQILPEDEYLSQIDSLGGNIVGISASLNQYSEVIKLAKILKAVNPHTVVIIGGSITSYDGIKTCPFIDLIVQGEAEEEIVEIVGQIESNRLELLEQGNPRVIKCSSIDNLDNLPIVDRNLFDMDRYLRIWRENTGITSTSIISSRGCPSDCFFCDKAIGGYQFRGRSARLVVDEMEYLWLKHDLDEIFFYDDQAMFDFDRVMSICDEIESRGLTINWSSQARVDQVSDELLSAIKQAGCSELYFGVESGSQKILDYLNKGFTVDQIIEAFRLCHKHKIKPGMFLIVGVPGESSSDIDATISLVRQCRPYLINFSFLTPFPGTRLYKKTEHLTVTNDVSSWDEMRRSPYKTDLFEIDPEASRDRIFQEYLKMIESGIEYSPLQFCHNE